MNTFIYENKTEFEPCKAQMEKKRMKSIITIPTTKKLIIDANSQKTNTCLNTKKER